MSNYHISDVNAIQDGANQDELQDYDPNFENSNDFDFNESETNMEEYRESLSTEESEEDYEFDGDSLLKDYRHASEENQKAENIADTDVFQPKIPSSLIGGLPRIPITIGKKKKARRVLKKEHTSLQSKNSNFVFVFGYTGSGKTTVLAAIDLYIRRKYAKTVDPTGNRTGINHINKIVRNISRGEFPNATPAGTIVEYDVALTHPVSDETINFTFIEMAGEDLRRINTDDEDKGTGSLRTEISKYLTCPDISISFLLIADYKERVENFREDDLFMNFFGYLRHLEVPLKNVGVVVSKFDKESTGQLLLSEVVDEYLPQTRRFMENRSIIEQAKIFPFSIGTVVEHPGEEPQITAVDLRDTGAVVSWLFDSFSTVQQSVRWNWKSFFR